MNAEEDKQLEQLLNKDASEAQQASALKWIGQFFEEDYILDLPRSNTSLKALEQFANRTTTSAKLKKQAQRLHKKFANR